MTKLIALFGLVTISILTSLGNYYFTFGLWPISWFSFTFFWLVSVALQLMTQAVIKDN